MLQKDILELDMEIISGQLSTLTLQPTIFDGIKGAQELDPQLLKLKEQVLEGKNVEFNVSTDGILHFKGRLCIPDDAQFKKQLLSEVHTTPYSVHPGATKMYQDLKERFWWSGELQPLEIPEWKWDQITMDFVVGLPKTTKCHDALWVVVDRLTKTPVHWYETGETEVTAPEFVEDTTQAVKKIHARMKSAQSRQKSYANKRRRPLEFQVGDSVFLKVSPFKGVIRFGKRGKLNPRYIGPYEILE
ncbi:hypothetical protein UlMin_009850 [Ulmus minor]